MYHSKHIILVALLFTLFSVAGYAAEPSRTEARERVYGWELMTDAERAEHRERLRNMNTEEEREAYREQHHKRMQERAKERGVDLPDEPMQRGEGMRQGGGMGHGPGDGQGMGGGRDR